MDMKLYGNHMEMDKCPSEINKAESLKSRAFDRLTD